MKGGYIVILGLDMATKKTGYSLLYDNGSLFECGLIRTLSEDTKGRMLEIYNAIEKIVQSFNIRHIVFEDVPVNTHSNIKTGKDLSVLQGVVLALCFRYNITYTLYNPSAWRSIVGTYDGTREGMKRDVQKQRAVELVNRLYDLGFVYNARETKAKLTDDDRAEAILIALAYIKEHGGEADEV